MAATMDYSEFTPLMIAVIIFAYIALRQLTERTRKVSSMWIMPVIMLYISFTAIAQDILSTPYTVYLLVPAVLLGCGIGLLRNKMVSVKLGDREGTLLVKGSILSILIWGATIAIRYAGRFVMESVLNTPIAVSLICALVVMTMSSTIFYYGYLYFQYYALLAKGVHEDYSAL